MIRLFAIATVVSVLALAGCGDDDDSGTEPTTTTQATQEDGGASAPVGSDGGDKPDRSGADEQAASGTEIVAADSQYGSILFDSKRQAIYLFDKETSSTSECYGACAEAWPPVLTDGEPQAGAGADAKLLGTTERDDGSTQVTYAGHPLYYYVDDAPGQVLCHNVEEFGGLWLVVEPSGEAVQ
jgi:predicted lipoprotein with Yx(FWY)xxD motif